MKSENTTKWLVGAVLVVLGAAVGASVWAGKRKWDEVSRGEPPQRALDPDTPWRDALLLTTLTSMVVAFLRLLVRRTRAALGRAMGRG